jgi:hypothetical protein
MQGLSQKLFALFALALTAAASSGAAADTAIATKWRLLGESQNDCLGHARSAISRSGFDVSDPGSQSMSGKRGEYTASIRCVAEQRMVFFVMSGPAADTTARYLDVLYQRF